MKPLYKNRLLKLAKHLESGKLAHEKFDFCWFNRGEFKNFTKPNKCGTRGCALGECPVLWKSWNWHFNSVVYKKIYSNFQAAEMFFGLSELESQFLFQSGGDDEHELSNDIGKNATKEKVAAHIRKFVEERGK